MKISTVNGPIDVNELGKTLMHEHLIIGFGGWEFDRERKFSPEDEIAICVDLPGSEQPDAVFDV